MHTQSGADASSTLLNGGTRQPPTATMATSAAQTLAGLMTLEAAWGGVGGAGIDNAWHGAEAYHFWLLAHRQLYAGRAAAAEPARDPGP